MKKSSKVTILNRERAHLLPNLFVTVDGRRKTCETYVDGNMWNAFFKSFVENVRKINLSHFKFEEDIIGSAIKF